MRFKQEFLDLFFETALERHRVYIKKESGLQKPWTDNVIYQKYFFCNVFRQYDKCSKWIIDNVVPLERWDLIILYRFLSTYDLFLEIEELGIIKNLTEVSDFLDSKHKTKTKAMFNGCFIRNPKIPGGWTLTHKVPFILIDEINKDDSITYVIRENSLEELVKYLSLFPATKGFMAYEYACDLEYTGYFYPTDKYTWANVGPGANKGMSWLLYGHPNTKIKEREWLELARILFVVMKEKFNQEFPEEDFSMREVEHWLCEFQKYMKYLSMETSGTRVKHRKYNGVPL